MSAVLVNDQVVRLLLADPKMRTLGCLAQNQVVVEPAKKPCNCRSRSKGSTTSVPVDQVRRCLYGMPEQELLQVKAHLRVDRLIFYFKEPGFPPRAVR